MIFSRHFFPLSNPQNTNYPTVKRLLTSKSICSDESNSIQENPYYEIMDSQGQETSFRIAHQNTKYRNSLEFPSFFRENEEILNLENNKTKIRFPSFESTFDAGFDSFLDQPDLQSKSPRDNGFFNDFTFDLVTDAKSLITNSRLFSDMERKVYWNLINNKIRASGSTDKRTSVLKYKIKKSRRKMSYKIRYKVRQDLAIKRLRNKGKFIKSKKMDIRMAANIIMSGQIIRKG